MCTLVPGATTPLKVFVFSKQNDFLAGLHGTCGWSEIQAPGTVWKQCSRGKDLNSDSEWLIVSILCGSRLKTYYSWPDGDIIYIYTMCCCAGDGGDNTWERRVERGNFDVH
jgi:hypothetical protein